MEYTSARNPVWGNAAHTGVDLIVDYTGHGELHTGAWQNSPEPHKCELFARAIAGDFGPIAEYVAPPPVIPTVVTMAQARLALLHAGLLPQVTSAIAALTGVDGDAARITWEFSPVVRRSAALVTQIATALGWGAAELDALFTDAGSR